MQKRVWLVRLALPKPPQPMHRNSHLSDDLNTCTHDIVFIRHDAVRKPLQPLYDGPYMPHSSAMTNISPSTNINRCTRSPETCLYNYTMQSAWGYVHFVHSDSDSFLASQHEAVGRTAGEGEDDPPDES